MNSSLKWLWDDFSRHDSAYDMIYDLLGDHLLILITSKR